MKGRWNRAFDDALLRFGDSSFTAADFAEVIRPHVNPMEAVRVAERRREYKRQGLRPDEYGYGRRKDDVTVGLKWMATYILNNKRRYPTVEHVERGVYRFVDPQHER